MKILCIHCKLSLPFFAKCAPRNLLIVGLLMLSAMTAQSQTFRELQAGETKWQAIYAKAPAIRNLADQGDSEAQYFMYLMLRASDNDPFPTDIERAFAYLDASAAAGYRAALTEISGQYLLGMSRKIDIYKAQEFYQLAKKTPFVRPFDEGVSHLLPRNYKAIIPPTYHMLKEDSEFMKKVNAIPEPNGGEAAYQAGLLVKKYFYQDTALMDHLFTLAAAKGHAEGTFEHAAFIYNGSGGPNAPTTDSIEARALFVIAADLGSENAKRFVERYERIEDRNEAKRQATATLIAAIGAFAASSEAPVWDNQQRDYEARQRSLQYGINTDLSLGWAAN